MPFVSELVGAKGVEQGAKPPVMRTDLPALVEHFVEETVVAVLSQHQSESVVLSSLLILELIKSVSGLERKPKNRWGNGCLGTPAPLINHNEQSHIRATVRVRPQPVAGETKTHAKTKAIGLPSRYKF
jgi:hypothetical protein